MSDAPQRAQTWSELGTLFRERRGQVVGLSASSLLAGLTESGILAIFAQVAGALVSGDSRVVFELGPARLSPSVAGLIVTAFVLALVRLLLQGLIAYLPARIAADTQAQMRIDLFASFARSSWKLQSADREGELQELMTNQVREATVATLQALTLLTAALTFLVLVISAFALDLVAAGIVLAAAAGLFFLLRPLSNFGHRTARSLSSAYVDYAGGVSEATRLAEEAHVFGVNRDQVARIEGLVSSAQLQFFRTQLLIRLVPGTYQSLIYLFVVAGLAVLYATDTGQAASLGAVILLLVRGGTYGQQAQGAYQNLKQNLPYIERLTAARERYRTKPQGTGTRPLGEVSALQFDNVSFSYQRGRPVLTDVSFSVEAGEAIGVIGPSGVGKSTLIQILLALRAPGSGSYLIDGVPVEDYAHEDWCRRVAYVPQEPRLLHTTVRDNIRFMRSFDDAAVKRAARLAGIHDEIVSWARGYDTVIGPRADAVSGGQQQRLCLARALVGQPSVLVLDEPTSALDPGSRRLIQQSLGSLKHELTLFIVAHDVSSLSLCDRVMVIVDGRIEAFRPTHELDRESTYFRSATAVSDGGSEDRGG